MDANVICTVSIKTDTINFSDYKQDLCVAMHPKAKRKRELMVDRYAGTIVATIGYIIVVNTSVAVSGNVHVEVPLIERNSY